MKFLVLLFVAIASISSNPITKSDDATLERHLRTVIERQRQNFPCGWPDAGENGVAPLDPLFIDEVIIETRGLGTRLTSVLTNLNLRGLRNFQVSRLNINSAAQTIHYTFSVGSMTLDGRHDTRGTMIGIPLVTGNGAMTATLTNSQVSGVIYWTTLPESGYMQLYDQITGIQSDVNVNMQGFGLLTGTVNRQVNELIPEMLNDPEFQQEVNEILNSIMLPVFNAFLYHMVPEEVAELLAYSAETDVPQRCFW